MKTRSLLLAFALLSLAPLAIGSTAPAIYKTLKTHRAQPAPVGNGPAIRAPAVGPDRKPEALRPSTLGAAAIVDRNVAARGGLKAWRGVNTLILSGQLEAGGVKNKPLPFVMEMKRPHKSRLEIRFQGKTAVQVYDGRQGWKVRPFLNRDEVEPFTPDEARLASTWAELDGPLVDYAGKGSKVEVKGMETVDGQDTYKLLVTLRDGAKRHVWIDAANFLERKIEGDPRKLDGRMHAVSIYYRDYGNEHGLMVPHTLETVVEGAHAAHKMNIEQVQVNAPLEDKRFTKPQLQVAAAQSAE
jgi:hypothetical protein